MKNLILFGFFCVVNIAFVLSGGSSWYPPSSDFLPISSPDSSFWLSSTVSSRSIKTSIPDFYDDQSSGIVSSLQSSSFRESSSTEELNDNSITIPEVSLRSRSRSRHNSFESEHGKKRSSPHHRSSSSLAISSSSSESPNSSPYQYSSSSPAIPSSSNESPDSNKYSTSSPYQPSSSSPVIFSSSNESPDSSSSPVPNPSLSSSPQLYSSIQSVSNPTLPSPISSIASSSPPLKTDVCNTSIGALPIYDSKDQYIKTACMVTPPNGENYYEAQQFCEANGMELYTVSNADEMDGLTEYIQKYFAVKEFWLNGVKNGTNWTSTYKSSQSLPIYSGAIPTVEIGNCLAYSVNEKTHGEDCSKHFDFFCEFVGRAPSPIPSLSPSPTNASLEPVPIKPCSSFVVNGRRISSKFSDDCFDSIFELDEDLLKMNETYWNMPTRSYVAEADRLLKEISNHVVANFNSTIKILADQFQTTPEQMRLIIFRVPEIPAPYLCIVGLITNIRDTYLTTVQQNVRTYNNYVDYRYAYDAQRAKSAKLAGA